MNESIGKRRKSKYFCNECKVGFELLTYFESRRKHCPKCGDFIAVTTLEEKGIVTGAWEDEELEWLDQCINGQITLDDLIKMTRRTRKAVWNRKSKRIKETKAPRRAYIPWTDEEKELVAECINGKISLEELIDSIDRSLYAVQMYFIRQRKKLRDLYEVKQNV